MNMRRRGHEPYLLLDDRAGGTLRARNGASWRVVGDTVMGGVSDARLRVDVVEGRPCLRMSGDVNLIRNGGFIQMGLDLGRAGVLDAGEFSGIEIEVHGNGETYNLHLRSGDTRIVWQSYRSSFTAPPEWRTLRLPFSDFLPHRIGIPLDPSRLCRLGVAAIGREMSADICVGRIGLYGGPAASDDAAGGG